MKNLKLVLIFMAFIGYMGTAEAQEGGLSGGVEFALPLGNLDNAAGMGIGASLQYEHAVAAKLGLLANAGFIYLTEEKDVVTNSYFIPVQVGFRFYPDVVGSGLFLGAQTGIHVYSVTMEEYDLGIFGTFGGDTSSETTFSAAPEVGFFLADDFSLALRYQFIFYEGIGSFDENGQYEEPDGSSLGYLGLRMAFHF